MRIQTILRVAAAALALILLAGACSQNPVGIFASVERERKILDDERGLDEDLNVAAMTEAGGTYFIAAGALYARDVNDPDYEGGDLAQWSAIDGPGTTNAVVSADLGSGVRVYALYTGNDGEGVYAVNPSTLEMADTPLLETGDTGSVGDDTVASIVDIFVVNDTTDVWLVVSVQESSEPNDYALYVTSDGSTFTELASSAPAEPFPYAPWTDAVSDGTDTAFMSSSSVLVDTDGNLGDDDLTAKTAPDLSSGDRLTGMIYDADTSSLWLADDAGHIYTSPLDAATGWDKSPTHEVSSSNDAALPFTDFALVPVDATTTNLVVGTRGYGYRVLGDTSTITYESAPQSPDLVADGSNYQGSELAGAVVQTFYVESTARSDYPVPTADGNPYENFDGYLFFAGTTNQGLWRALSYDGAVQWVRE